MSINLKHKYIVTYNNSIYIANFLINAELIIYFKFVIWGFQFKIFRDFSKFAVKISTSPKRRGSFTVLILEPVTYLT